MKKLFSLLLVVAMLACMLPVFAVSAANPEVPVAKMDGTVMTGATAHADKAWTNDANGLKTNENDSIFVFDQEFKAGTIEYTINAPGGDNGVIFGLDGDSMNFWEQGPQYYFVFIQSGGGEIIIAKTGGGLGWTWMKSRPISNYTHGTDYNVKIEYDGEGHIVVYGGGELVYDFCDAKPLTGTRAGVRAQQANVTYTNVKFTTSEVGGTGIKGGYALPFAKVGDKTLTGYLSGGPWTGDGKDFTITDTALTHDNWASTFIIDNDTLPLTDGSLSGTVKAGNANKAENFITGLVFGLEATKNVTVWKNSKYTAKYYVLFADGEGKLVLSKGGTVEGDDGLTELAKSENAIEGYVINEQTVDLKAEFKMVDGKLVIKGYANGVELLSYTDAEPLTGARYGFMARCGGSQLTSLVPVNNVVPEPETKPVTKPAETGDMTVLTMAVATLAIIGTGVVISKKRSFN